MTAALSWLARPNWSRIALALITILTISALLSFHLIPDRVALRAGQVSPIEVRAHNTVRYIDQEETSALQDAAAARVDRVYDVLPHATTDADETVAAVMDYARRELKSPSPSAAHLDGQLRQHVGVFVQSPSVLLPLLQGARSGYRLDQLESALQGAVHDAVQEEIRDDHPSDMQRAVETGTTRLQNASLAQDYIPVAASLLRAILRPNRHYNSESTHDARDNARRMVAPITNQIFAGDIVVRRGETVTPDVIEKLHALGLQNSQVDRGMVLSITVLVCLLVLMVCVYIARNHRAVYCSTKMLVLLSLLVCVSILSLKVADSLMGIRLTGSQFGYAGMLCVAAAGMLMGALVNTRIALVVSTLMAAQSGLTLGYDVRFPVMTLLSSLVAIFAVSDIRDRWDIMRAALVLSFTNLILTVIVGRIEGDRWTDIERAAFWAVLSGFLAVGIFALGAAFCERLFGITTHLGLLELCDPNRRLLQEFCQVAPGTYTHSVMVGNLAVAAAEAIGADALLCRVGAYYHDLGKMRRAEFFVENQNGGDNVHDRLSPSLSALVVTAHVKDGLEIAEQEKLPPVVKAFITEHHGTSLIRYFYHQHCSDNGDRTHGLEQHFRYGGPKPQSRETAILMLADGVEAASRTLERPTICRIGDLVDKIFQSQLGDGQLDECDLTLKDLRLVRNAFVHLLGGMMHSRIEYPDVQRAQDDALEVVGSRGEKNGIAHPAADKAVADAGAAQKAKGGDQSSIAA
ncbi:MAG: HD family phosphohydrolase [Capsulimonadaceae bacterium]